MGVEVLVMRKWINTTIRDPFDWRLYVNWLDAVNLVFAWIMIRDDALFLTCLGVLLFAITLWVIRLKWSLRRNHPLLLVA